MLTGIGNPRVMIVARVAIVLCHLMPEEVGGASRSGNKFHFYTTSQTSLLYLQQMVLLGFFPTTLCRSVRDVVIQTHVSRVAPDCDL